MGKISEIIVHIGLEKTGTTSIQMFLADQKALLREQGVACSGCLGWYNHKLLAAYGLADGSRDIAVTSAGIDGPESHAAFREKTRGHVLAEIDRFDARRYLLTSEDLSRLNTVEDVRRVHALLSEICDRFRVIVFLRRQDLLAVSRYYSLILNGSLPREVFPAAGTPGARYYDYEALLDVWAQVFGDEAIRLVRFPDRPEGEGFDSIGAFCEAAGIALPADWQASSRRDNSSLDAVGQVILEEANGLGGPLLQKLPRKRLLDLLRSADAGLDGHFVSADEARAFLAPHVEGNHRLLARFGQAQDFFSDDFSMYPEHKPDRGVLEHAALGRLVAILGRLLAETPLKA